MTNTAMSARFAESDFRVGRVLGRAATIFSQNFVIFFLVAVVAALPTVLLIQRNADAMVGGAPSADLLIMIGVGFLLAMVLGMLSQAVMLHAAFQAMRHRAVSLGESLRVGFARVIPILLLAIVMGFLMGLGFLLLIVPGLILLTMWWVATPACVVERTGPWTSLKRSAVLTKGHRWKVFGLLLLLFAVNIIVSQILEVVIVLVGSDILSILARLLWGALYGAYNAIAVVMSYHDLRVAKEGIDIEQIASVFD
jgi:hypothetical protein